MQVTVPIGFLAQERIAIDVSESNYEKHAEGLAAFMSGLSMVRDGRFVPNSRGKVMT